MRTGPIAGPIGAWRRGFLIAALCIVAVAHAAAPPAQRRQREDFDAMWRAIGSRYAYLAGQRGEWNRSAAAFRARAAAAPSREQFIGVLEAALATLHDDHVTLSERTGASPRRVPAETDIWAEWRGKSATVESVRVAGEADIAGLRPGAVILAVDGVPVEIAVKRLLGRVRNPTPAQRDWALRHLLAGPRAGTLSVDIAEPNGMKRLDIERSAKPPSPTPPLVARRMGEKRDIGYIRLKALDDENLPVQLDGALNYVVDTRALILDLRETLSGSRNVTRAVLARFAKAEGPWRIVELRDGRRVPDRIAPAGDAQWRAPLLVLVDRWTAGESEALAAGLDAVADAQIVGTGMAGLRGELQEERLPNSGIVLRYPAQRVLHADGRPLESLRPDVWIDPAAPSGGPGDPILYQALKIVEGATPSRASGR